ncbi:MULTISPECIES: hypothetical protein [Yersinia pseudotuberculosis complex]|uniref:Uncharacterized protein n=1 Tax=Yersinia wautersii TaxID=1341643 RepID=A0ABP1ZII0_9GAMM|nr:MULTISPECIES: hypothetical protein [Yersinia pseudotuberculosis complex]CNM15860.1 Uncharacterised protein [Yersinia pseudotuberculosis]CRG52680.1 Uncharacterised protein [Yersinia wautersii]
MTEKLVNVICDGYCLQGNQLVDFRYLSGTLELVLASSHADKINKIRMVFDWVHSFRATDEGDLLTMQDDLNGQMTIGIYTVEGSHYLAWFNEQSANIHDGDTITHYLIVTGGDVIDVLSSVSPTISYC